MIVRISRARIRRNSEAPAFELLRNAVGASPTPQGLIAFAISRRMVEGQLELMAMTTWRDMASMAAVLGPEFDQTAWLPGLDPLLESSDTALYETIAESFERFGVVETGDVDLLGALPSLE